MNETNRQRFEVGSVIKVVREMINVEWCKIKERKTRSLVLMVELLESNDYESGY